MFTRKAVSDFCNLKCASPLLYSSRCEWQEWPSDPAAAKKPAEFCVVCRLPFWHVRCPVLCLRHTTFQMYFSQPVTKTCPKPPKTGPSNNEDYQQKSRAGWVLWHEPKKVKEKSISELGGHDMSQGQNHPLKKKKKKSRKESSQTLLATGMFNVTDFF